MAKGENTLNFKSMNPGIIKQGENYVKKSVMLI